ncbi:MAG: acyl carrier protein [Oscillospiraceae bacterium]|nr:acyl carrier protein [Oscillospiraceae bacterium]
MTIAQVKEEILAVIRTSTETEMELTPETNLVQEMGLSSVETMLLLSDLEDRFGITIPASSLRSIQTVNDLSQTVISLLMKP